MWRYSALRAGGGAPTPTPTQATRTYDTTGAHFGLNTPAVDLTAGTANVVGSPGNFGTLSSDIDGIDLTFTPLLNASGGLLIIYANGAPIITWPVNPSTTFSIPQVFSIPIRVLSSVALSAAWACLSGGGTCHVAVAPFQSSVPETITSWTCLGNTAGNLNAQGVKLLAVTDLSAWKPVGTLGAGGAKAISVLALTSDAARTGSNSYIIDIGIGPTGSEALLIPAIAPRPRDVTNALHHSGSGPRRVSIAGSTQVNVRAKTEAGALPDDVNVQVVVGA